MALSSHSYPSSFSLFLSSPKKPLSPFKHLFFSSSSLQNYNSHNTPTKNPKYPYHPPTPKKTTPHSSPWLQKWSPSKPDPKINSQNAPPETRYFDTDKARSAIERIVHRLRNLGLESDDEDEDVVVNGNGDGNSDGLPWAGEEKLGDLLQRSWARPDTIVSSERDETLLPWERGDDGSREVDDRGVRKKRVKAPTLAELTIEDSELRRLRREGMVLRERVSVAKAGVTQAVLEKIHQTWRKSELVRLKFHESLAHDMRTAHEIVERRTGGLVTWRSGSVMVVYRGSNYEGPSSRSPSSDTQSTQNILQGRDAPFVPDVSSADDSATENGSHAISSTAEKVNPSVTSPIPAERMTEEEAEYNSLLDGLGPRFVDWWGTGFLPVDADLLPQHIPGYKTPFRLLPTGMRPRLTNAEMTSLRKLARSLPCHFALGRNRNHQGLAAAIVKLWEKSLVVKIAVKRGIQNTNNKLMAEELKMLTGGILLLRNKYYIVIYRGKDFLPTSVAAALAERQELTKDIQDVEEKARTGVVGLTSAVAALSERSEWTEDNVDVEERSLRAEVGTAHMGLTEGQAAAGTLAEFLEAQARWGREVSTEEHEKMKEEASRAKTAKVVKRIEHKLAVAQAKKLRAEKLLSKIEASMVPVGPSDDQETITDEERFMFRRVGLRMKAYLPLGIRGVFDGVIENMHLHWKHRELVKLISKQKTLAFVEDTARLLEYESGGILVAIERVPKGYALIYYRGKNYQRPISIRPRNLLTKAKALKRSVAMQRHEALSQHISELESTIEQMRSELGNSKDSEDGNAWSSGEEIRIDGGSQFTQSEDEDSFLCSDEEEEDGEENIGSVDDGSLKF
ncbi:CRM-domain containing factor CFM3B, chloroplastic [Magnolia sinica]|uniref:CRM-domain containing factor CFM3B, chloroplastic n=1 Tax=Magnolia sinica TaxID=86752 RepID=UPI0026594809|nr:CRM-domain containing factor CFM3B, chloroplastic [Magnolia sinica]